MIAKITYRYPIGPVESDDTEYTAIKNITIEEYITMLNNVFPEDGDYMSEVDFRKILKDTACHFYELGLNARKEDK